MAQLSLFTKKIELSRGVVERLSVLSKFNIRVAKMLLWSNKIGVPPEYLTNLPADFIDLDKEDMLSFLAVETKKMKGIEDIWKNGRRTTVKAGKIVRKIFSETALEQCHISDQDVETFTNGWKNLCLEKDERFEVIRGVKIREYYDKTKYYDKGNVHGTTLYNSCMSGGDANKFLNFYVVNSQISLVVIFKDKKVAARALMWTFIDEEKNEEFKVIDRVYYIKNSYYDYYKIMAVGLNAWIKDERGGGFINPKTSKTEMMTWVFEVDEINFDYYPYFDTFCYLNQKKSQISNDNFPGSRMIRTSMGVAY